jgi:sec-independent protein translocase protein TatA
MCGLGTWELLIVLAIVVLLFGAARLPQLGKALGETVRSFKKGQAGPDPVQESEKKEPLKAHAEVAQIGDGDKVEDAVIEGEDGDGNKPAG